LRILLYLLLKGQHTFVGYWDNLFCRLLNLLFQQVISLLLSKLNRSISHFSFSLSSPLHHRNELVVKVSHGLGSLIPLSLFFEQKRFRKFFQQGFQLSNCELKTLGKFDKHIRDELWKNVSMFFMVWPPLNFIIGIFNLSSKICKRRGSKRITIEIFEFFKNFLWQLFLFLELPL